MRILSVLASFLVLGFAFPAAAEIRVEPEVQAPSQAKALQQRGTGRARKQQRIDLEAPGAAELAQLEPSGKTGVPHKIGFPRPIASLQGDEGTGRALDWESLDDGTQVAAVAITSPGAAALRLGLRVTAVPADALFRFHDLDGDELFEVSGADVLAAIEANRAAGERGPDARTYWSPVIESDTLVMEIELPEGTLPSALRMSVPLLSHLAAAAKDGFSLAKAAAACNFDATCQVAAWGSQMNAISRMVFSSGGYSYICTGTLLADTDPSTTIPYFLTANHCIGSQTAASSLVNYWFYRSASCNGAAGAYVRQAGGATLLHSSTATDVSFLRLNATPPAGATYAGWRVGSPVPLYSTVTGLHHPTGDLLKISGGNVAGYLNCTAPTSGQFSCSNASSANAGYYDVAWTSGVVEPGSSGSALFDGGKYVVGQLYGGSSTCQWPGAGDSYGRFDVSFNGGLSAWLDPPPPPEQRLTVTKSGAGAGVVSTSPAGIDCGPACSALFPYGSSVTLTAAPGSLTTFGGWGGACAGTGSCTVAMNAAVGITATFNRVPEADLELVQAANPGTGVAGKDVAFDMTATNRGPDAATGVTVYAAYDADATVVWASPACEKQPGTAIYACPLGTLANGATAQVKLVLRKEAAGSLYNNAGVSSATGDPDPSNNAPTLALLVDGARAGVPVLRYRLYSPVTQEHHYTTDRNEYEVLGALAGTWVQEGTVGRVLDNPGTFGGVAVVPNYRLYNTSSRRHHWTVDANEYYTLTQLPWWIPEGVDGYLLPTAAPGTMPLYRLRYPFVGELHHWTADANEYATLVALYGWIGEGIAGYVIE